VVRLPKLALLRSVLLTFDGVVARAKHLTCESLSHHVVRIATPIDERCQLLAAWVPRCLSVGRIWFVVAELGTDDRRGEVVVYGADATLQVLRIVIGLAFCRELRLSVDSNSRAELIIKTCRALKSRVTCRYLIILLRSLHAV